MHNLRLAVATRCLKLPLRESLRAAADCGAAGVQFDLRDELRPAELTDTGRRQLAHALGELGLKVASATFPTRRSFADQQELDARVAATRAAMEFAWSLRATTLSVRLGKLPSEKESPEYRLLHEVVSDLARHGNHVGVTLAVHPVHDAPDSLREFCGSVQSGFVGVDFDPAAFVIGGHKPADAFRQLHQSIVHFTARDSIRDAGGGGLEVPLGRGEIEWVELLPLLDEIAYPGWVTVARTQGADQRGDVARGVEYLKNVGIS
jgi:sugar phosphate isomerase/epimerase